MAKSQELKDVINNAEHLLFLHPAPWRIAHNLIGGYVVDARERIVFGGEKDSGNYVYESDAEATALVDVINSLRVYIRKGE